MLMAYTKWDCIFAVAFYIFQLGICYIGGIVYTKYNTSFGVHINLFMAALCIALVLMRKQSMSSIGFTLLNIVTALMQGQQLITL